MPLLRREFAVLCLFFVALTLVFGAEWHRPTIPPSNILAAHNEIRAQTGLPPLRWSEHLAAYAQQWADRLLRDGEFRHRPHPIYGENLFEINGPRATPAQVVDVWASEARDYDYRSNACHGMCGHYTQLIWSTTREVGCAVARDSVREVWVCNYDPPGNWIGERPY